MHVCRHVSMYGFSVNFDCFLIDFGSIFGAKLEPKSTKMAPKWSQVEAKLGYGNMVAFLTSFLTLFDPLWGPTWTLNWSQVGPKLDQNGHQFLHIFYIDFWNRFLVQLGSNLAPKMLQI